MPLADDVLDELKRRPHANPDFVQLGMDVAALCTVLDRRLADENRRGSLSDLSDRDIEKIKRIDLTADPE